MNRPYGSEQIARAVAALRKIKQNPFISCDIIAGFPRETDEDFCQTLALCRECAFSWIHAFPFSPRPGTAAFGMDGAVPQSTVKKRCAALAKIARTQKAAYTASCAGKVFAAIVEQGARAKQSDDGLRAIRAVTENFLHVELALSQNAAPPAPGSQILVRVIGQGARKARDAFDARAELAR
jgi:threonylcarbamoyladenosine tRNA methylthiotransferase MtaB